ncbi:MAG: hypothetical protein BWY13_00938 [Euryarchaeota archaeon ADurb.Bin190]|nr:MAG: hypothetical protein BWY13_00938 [Euryarchaeota archaeon ADurb.Bin190]
MRSILEFGDHGLESEVVDIIVDAVCQYGESSFPVIIGQGIVHKELLIEGGRYLHLVLCACAIEIVHIAAHKIEVDGMAHLMG